ncbi:hypothetical protein DXG01_011314 [Tephrocybe rancida]|nr:hypothetical protein DXG01_011314 [Tephrocybe rancida]
MPSLQPATLDNTVGALLLGAVGAAFLYGFTTLQTFWYFHRWSKDSPLHRYSVGILWFLDTVHLAFVVHAVYTYIATGFGQFAGLEIMLWSVKAQIAINVIVVLMVQSLYSYRVWILGGYHRGILGYLVIALLLAGFVIGIILAYEVCTVKSFTETGRISFTLSSGLFTSACSLSAMFCYILLPETFVYLAIQFILTKLYVGSFFAMLNARERTNEGGSSKYDPEGSKGTPLRVHLHTTSYTTSPTNPTVPASALSRDLPATKVYPWK